MTFFLKLISLHHGCIYEKMMMMMMMIMNCLCGMVDRRKAFNLISSRDHCQRFSPSRISDTPRAVFEPAQNLSSGLVEWSCTAVITTTPRRHDLKCFFKKEKFLDFSCILKEIGNKLKLFRQPITKYFVIILLFNISFVPVASLAPGRLTT